MRFMSSVAFSLLCTLSFATCQMVSAQDSPWIAPNPFDIQRANQAKAYFNEGMRLHEAGDFPAAIAAYKKSLDKDPKNKLVHHYLALVLSQSGDDQASIPEFRTALNIDYNFVQCRNNYALVLKKLGQTREAMNLFKQCIQIDPKYPDAYYHLGELLEQLGDLDGAIENYETATRLNPNYPDAQRDLGLAIYKRADANIEVALEKLLIAEKLVPTNPKIHYYIGTIYAADARLDEAEKEFRQALACDSNMAIAHWELAKLRYYRGDLDRCISEIKQTEAISPEYTKTKGYPPVDPVELKRKTAVSLEFKNQRIQAVEAYKELASLVKVNQDILKHINDLETQLRREAKARKKPPMTYDPAEVDAIVARGINQMEDGDLDSAKLSFERAIQLNPNSFEATQNLGAALETMGDLNAALAKYQEAVALNPQYDGAYYNVAYVLEKLNLPADAGSVYKKFHEIAGRYPYDPRHIVALQQMQAHDQAKQDQLRKRGY